MNIKQLLQECQSHWSWFVVTFVVCLCVAGLYWVGTNKKYAVEGSIMIRTADERTHSSQAELMSLMGYEGNKQVDDEIAILTSKDIAMQVVRELGMNEEIRHRKGLRWEPVNEIPNRSELPTAILRTKIKGRDTTWVVKVDGEKYKIRHRPIETIAEQYTQLIRVTKLKQDSYIIKLSTRTDSPARAVAYLNKLIELYNFNSLMEKNSIAGEAAFFIDERLRMIEQELTESEAKAEAYRQNKNIVNPGDEAKVYFSQTTSYQQRLADLKTQQNLIAYVEDFIAHADSATLIPANLGIDNSSLHSLIDEYNNLIMRRMRISRAASESNPVIEQLDDQIATIRASIGTSIESAKSSLAISIRDLESQNKLVRNEMNQSTAAEREYTAISRDRQLKEQLYLYLYQKREENAITLASTLMPAKVVDTPKQLASPVNHQPKRLILIILLVTLALPIGCIYLKDLLSAE